jgi:aspartate-semialdehyde dehydrogenase
MYAQILSERKLPIKKLHFFEAPHLAGQTIDFEGKPITVEACTPEAFGQGIDIALFGVRNEISREFAPIAASKGCIVVDNSSAWRMDPAVPLIVPEVNGEAITGHRGIIANPNCCATPAVVALSPLHKAYTVKRAVISTYQSVSGAGVGGVNDLEATLKGEPPKQFPHVIAHNIIPHIDVFDEEGYTGEERKLIAEIRKMLDTPGLNVTATTVRVPVYKGHSLSINVTFEKPFDLTDVRKLITGQPGAVLMDDPSRNLYPMPLTVAGTDDVCVGRVRRDESCENSLNLWVVADNVRKGAATNAVQIVERLMAD